MGIVNSSEEGWGKEVEPQGLEGEVRRGNEGVAGGFFRKVLSRRGRRLSRSYQLSVLGQ
jgi:hypothetical protein